MYVTDAIKYINGSIANMLGGSMVNKRFVDLLNPQKEETRSPKDIIEHISDKLNKLAG